MPSPIGSSTTSTSLAFCLALALGAGCSSGGGGGGAIPPTIVTAAYVGAGPTPAAGDFLIVTVSKSSTLLPGVLLTDADFVFTSANGVDTLGAVSEAPTALSPQSIRIRLGSGVTFTPGTTTVAFSDIQDAIVANDGAIATGGSPRTITAGDGSQPVILNLTCNAIEDPLNGDGNAGGTLQVPRSGFDIDVTTIDANNPLDVTRTFLASTLPVVVAGMSRSPGSNLADALVPTVTSAVQSFRVPADVAFQEGAQVLTAITTDVTGMSSDPTTFTLVVRALADAVRPFEARQVWFLDTSRDIESFGNTVPTVVSVTPGANSRSDLEDLFHILGLQTAAPVTGADSNTAVMQHFRARVSLELDALFDQVPIDFTFDSPGSFPTGQSSVPFGSAAFSQICIAGSASNTPSGVLGSALFDENNDTQNDNCIVAFGVNQTRLGVFPFASISLGVQTGPSSDFRQTFDPFRPSVAGTPIGQTSGDAARMAEVLAGTNAGNDPRIADMEVAIRKLARLIAVVVAHECGHSMGLVANDPMPNGLYGNDPVNFPLSGGQPDGNANGHIQNTSLFPSGSQNIMSPAINFDAAQSNSTVFNSLNLAYLRERVIYVPN